MNKTMILAAASAAALFSTVPAFAQANQQGSGFVTLDLNWTETGTPAASDESDADAMKQMLERDQARVEWIRERQKAKAPAIRPELVKDDAPKTEEAKDDAPKTTTITVPLTRSGNTLTGDQMRQILERDQARVRGMQERVRAAQEKAEQEKTDAPKTGTVPADVTLRPTTVTTPVAPPDSTRPATRGFTSDQMRQIVERDRARAKAMGERIRAAQVEAEAEKYLKEHPVEFTPGKTPAGWLDNFTAATGKAKAEKKPILALFTGSDWCPPCQQLEKNILLQPAFKDFAKQHLVTVFLDFPREAKLDEGVKNQNDALAKKFSVEAYPTILVLSSDGEKELWKQVGYTALFLEKLKEGLMGLDKEFPDTAKALKDAKEAEAKAKAEKEKAELEEFEKKQKEQKELEDAWDQYSSPGIIDPAEQNPWGTGRIRSRGNTPLNDLSDAEREALFRELDKNGPIKGPDVLPNGGPAPIRNHVKRD